MKARELIDAGEIGRPSKYANGTAHGSSGKERRSRKFLKPATGAWMAKNRVAATTRGSSTMPYISSPPPNTLWVIIPSLKSPPSQPPADPDSDGGGAAHDPYSIPGVDIPIITWKYEDTDRQGVWMRAERLNGKYDYMHGFSTTVIGERGMIEVLGEGGHNLLWKKAAAPSVASGRGGNPRLPL